MTGNTLVVFLLPVKRVNCGKKVIYAGFSFYTFYYNSLIYLSFSFFSDQKFGKSTISDKNTTIIIIIVLSLSFYVGSGYRLLLI